MKKVLKITGITLITLIALAFLIPVVFKKQIQALVKKEINKSINATVDFSDVKLSLFKHFPKATISISGLSIVGVDGFAKDTLLSSKKIDVTAGLFSVLKGKDVKVYGIYCESPRIHAIVNKFGKANWDIAKSSGSNNQSDTAASAFKMGIKKYEINNGHIIYDDQKANAFAEVKDLDHSGSGDLAADIFTLSTDTKASSVYYSQNGMPYLINTKTAITSDIKIDNKTNTYTFKTDDIKLNDLALSANGFVKMVNSETYDMDIQFKSPTNSFKNILSLAPAMYTAEFDKLKTSGEAAFTGFVKGTYSPQQIPAYDVNLQVNNGSFQYPDLPKPVKNINLSLHAFNTDGKPDNTVIDIPKGHLEMDNQPFDFRFVYKNPETIQLIDASVKGTLDLSQVSKFIKLENGTQLSGIVAADAFAKGPMKALQQQTGPFSAGGFFDIKNLFYTDKNFPQPIRNGNMKATLNNSGGVADKTTIDITAAHIEVGNNPVDFSLQLKNPVSTVDFNGHAKGTFNLDHLKQFTSLPSGTSVSGMMSTDADFAGSRAAINKGEYDKITLNGKADFANVNYISKDYATGIKVPSSQLVFNAKNVALNNCTASYLNTNFTAKGILENLVGYMMKGQTLSGTITATADNMNLNDWMGTTPATNTASTTATKPSATFAVPANINLTINAAANKVTYDKVDYTNINGTLVMNDEKVQLQNIKSNALDGTIAIDGSYSTKVNKEKPDMSLSYNIQSMDAQKAFYAYNTMQSLMPIGKFLSGKLTSQLSMTGNLDGQMMPLLNSLSGKGNLFLLEGVLAKFAPLEKIASVLEVDRLKSISIKDIKNFIEFSNGKVLVKPFTVKVQDIEMEIAGLHGIDQSLDYGIQMKLPRRYLGNKGNNLINGLISSANSKGVPIKMGDIVNLNIKLTGSINNPSVAVNLKEVAGDAMEEIKEQAKDFAQSKIDSAKQKTKDSLTVIKNQGEQKIKEKLADKGIDTTNVNLKNMKDTVVQRVKDTLKKKATDTIKNRLKKLFGSN
jgi:hypothetical protein